MLFLLPFFGAGTGAFGGGGYEFEVTAFYTGEFFQVLYTTVGADGDAPASAGIGNDEAVFFKAGKHCLDMRGKRCNIKLLLEAEALAHSGIIFFISGSAVGMRSGPDKALLNLFERDPCDMFHHPARYFIISD